MQFYFDESGNFQLPPAGEHRAGIVSGVAIPESDQAEVFRQFDAFLSKLPASSFKNGEPKGRLLDDTGRKALADMLVDLPGILLCPIIIVGNREERVFETMLPMWVSSWSHDEPFTEIEGIHTPDHPLVKNWDCDDGLDVGKMLKNNVHYVSSASSKGIQLADMTASLVRRSVVGVVNFIDLQNYGLMMTKTIGKTRHACGMFCLAPADIKDLERRYHGLADAINAARGPLPSSCKP